MEQYYYLDAENQRKGPVVLSKLLWAGVKPQTLIWKKGMENWQPAESLPEVAALFRQSAKPVPPPLPEETPRPTQRPTPQPAQNTSRPLDFKSKPDNYLVWAILTTAFCCLPFGIPAIVYSTKVDSKWNVGDYAGALSASKQAKTFCWIAFGLGLLSYVSVIIFYFFVIYAAVLMN